MRSLSSSRKGQFFILSAVAIVTILFFIGRWSAPTSLTDTSSTALMDELFTADNIIEKAGDVVKQSRDCDGLTYNLQEYENFIKDFAREKNYKVTFRHWIKSCSAAGATVDMDVVIASESVDAEKSFTVTAVWA